MTGLNAPNRWLLVAALTFSVAACEQKPANMMAQYPSPMAEEVRAHERIHDQLAKGDTLSVTAVLNRRVRVLVPEAPADQGLLIHFHGAAYVPFAVTGYVVASVNLGSGSGAYERPFADPEVFPNLVRALEAASGTAFNQVTLSGWSAGYGSIRAILREHPDRIAQVVLLDGLHTDYVPDRTTLFDGGHLNAGKLEPFLVFARQAAAGTRRMIITHSEIFPGTYASTTETAAFIAAALGLERKAVLEWGPGGMQLISRAEQGNLTILGYAGNTAPDHVDHLHALPALLSR
ncbi:MAG: hypothetical protein HKN29_09485 [Rhodothermales bacterium]|nr:hypothetical protein [Rhodothermales bacterium]